MVDLPGCQDAGDRTDRDPRGSVPAGGARSGHDLAADGPLRRLSASDRRQRRLLGEAAGLRERAAELRERATELDRQAERCERLARDGPPPGCGTG